MVARHDGMPEPFAAAIGIRVVPPGLGDKSQSARSDERLVAGLGRLVSGVSQACELLPGSPSLAHSNRSSAQRGFPLGQRQLPTIT